MRGLAFAVVFGFVACAIGNAVTSAGASSELKEWQTAAGNPPSKNEFAAVVAACEDRAKSRDVTGPIESCLADYGLHRAQ
jgi:hypothetical protein